MCAQNPSRAVWIVHIRYLTTPADTCLAGPEFAGVDRYDRLDLIATLDYARYSWIHQQTLNYWPTSRLFAYQESLVCLRIPFCLVAFLLVLAGRSSLSGAERPNVLFIVVDDLRPELGCYGNQEIKTPHFGSFSESATTFTRAYCQAAACAPSRAAVMTGLRPDTTRVWDLKGKFRVNMPDVVTLPQHFHAHGYYTVSMGKIFHNHMPDRVSFDEADLRPKKYLTPDMIDRDPESFCHDEVIQKELADMR